MTTSLRYTRRFFLLLSGAAGLYFATAYWNYMHSDGLQYIEMGDKLAHGDWSGFVNAYWSPLYPALLSLFFSLFRVPPTFEFGFVKLINALVLVAATAAYSSFVSSLLATRSEDPPRRRSQIYAACLTAFLWVMIEWNDHLILTTPDVFAVACGCTAMSLLVRLVAMREQNTRSLLRPALLLGAALGLSYLAKAAMLLWGLMVIACLPLTLHGSWRKRLILTCFVGAAQLGVSAPWMIAISRQQGHFTMGDSGKLNHAWFVGGLTKYIHWQGEDPRFGIPLHTTRKIFSAPDAYEFATPIVATYPPWYNPAYWYAGAHQVLNRDTQKNRILYGLERLEAHFYPDILLLFLVLWLIFTGGLPRLTLGGLGRNAYLLLPALGATGLFVMVLVLTRYISGFVMIFMTALLLSARSTYQFRHHAGRWAGAFLGVYLAARTGYLGFVGHPSSLAPTTEIRTKAAQDMLVAQELTRAGIAAGTHIGTIAAGYYAPWTRVARLQIVAEIPSSDDLWLASKEKRYAAEQSLFSAGATIVFAANVPVPIQQEGWKVIDGTHWYSLKPADLMSPKESSPGPS
ncbi:MAG: hypothetical protein JST16_11055 [Bdellovibrionales bacterium]|nr:hypothetical protein [Bdellovibrionales bacterium]